MRTNAVYTCEICGETYGVAADAIACEALGLPAPMPYLPWDRKVPLFGENGVEHAQILWVRIVRNFRAHAWLVYTRPWVFVSHNLMDNDQGIPASAFDPREGVDAFRYDGDADDVATWERALREYGFAEDEASEWVRDAVTWRRAEIERAKGANSWHRWKS